MEPDKIKHLDYVQSAINRMADNSFKIKGIAITLLSAFVGIYVKTGDVKYLIVILLPLLLFWFLDSYYLQQERKFRAIYDELIGKTNKFHIGIFEMPLEEVTGSDYKILSVMFSKTEGLLYFGLIILIVLYCSILQCNS